MADVITGSGSGTALRCRYSGCRSVLAYSGRGRPPEYCAERRWPGGKTCKQLAAAEREAELAAGLDVPLTAYREATGRMLPAVEGLAAQLAGVLAAMSAVEAGAVARIEQAEAAAVAAVERAQLAEAERDRATRLAQQARDEATQAKDAARAADRRAREAEAKAERKSVEAWDRVAVAERAKGRAEATVTAETQRRDAAEQRAADLSDQLATMRRELADARTEIRATDTARHAAQQRADRAEASLAAVTAERDAARTDTDRLRTESADQIAELRARLSAAEQRADTTTTSHRTAPRARGSLHGSPVTLRPHARRVRVPSRQRHRIATGRPRHQDPGQEHP